MYCEDFSIGIVCNNFEGYATIFCMRGVRRTIAVVCFLLTTVFFLTSCGEGKKLLDRHGRPEVSVPTSVLVELERPRSAEPACTPPPTLAPPPKTAEPEPTPFSIAWLSDTQAMAYGGDPRPLKKMGEWIADEKEERNILFVVQTGDAVENGFSDWQWKNFDACYDAFKDTVPYIAIAGNHEISIRRHDYAAYLARPNVRDIPHDNTFERGRAVYATFEAGGTKFILLGAGWESEGLAANWMNEVLRAHPDYVAILLFHGYLQGSGRFTIPGKQMFEEVVKTNPNVRLVLCGHVNGVDVRYDELDDDGDGVSDRCVTAMMYNYQSAEQDCGQLRLLTFNPADRSMTVLTYSPFTKRMYRDYHFSSAEFTIDNAF